MQDSQRIAGERAAGREGEETPGASLWLRQVRAWLDALSYQPERRYMRGESGAAPAPRH
jgi:hypothetical protein